MRVLIAFLFCFVFSFQFIYAEKKTYTTQKISGEPPNIDGLINETVWDLVEWDGGFVQIQPYENKPPSQQTEFKVLYDDNNLYFAIRAYDTAPDSIEKRMSRRDGFEGDWVEVNIDSYHDLRTAFSFTITASGVKGDEAISNDGDNWDSNWDPIWYVKTSIDAKGWIAEMKIPFSQLRFGKQDVYTWGLQVNRRFFRKEERSSWQFISPNASGWVHLFGELHGIKGIKPQKQKDIVPYVLAGYEKYEKEEGNPFAPGHGFLRSVGLDSKIGITNDLTLDLTINPDFGQVESDPSVVNLSAFETFYNEKRPFFIEGRNIMSFGLTIGDGPLSIDNLFYSRRIGRPPHHYPETDDSTYSKVPVSTSILGAMKLTGKTKKGWSIGVLEATTQKEKAEIDYLGKRRFETAEPFTNYFLTRIQKDMNNSNTRLGGMVTALNRNIKDSVLFNLHRSAYTGGIDFTHQWKEKTYYFNFNTVVSYVTGETDALLETQSSSIRYYQRPDADYITYDSTRTSLTGTGGMINFGRAGNSKFPYTFWITWRSPGLELNDIGYLYRGDEVQQVFWIAFRQHEPFSIFRNLYINWNEWYGANFGGECLYWGGNMNFGLQFKNYWSMGGGIGYNGESLSQTELRGGPSFIYPASLDVWYNASTDYRKKIVVYAYGGNSFNKYFHAQSYGLSLSVRVNDAFSFSLNPNLTINYGQTAHVDNVFDTLSNSTKYIKGNINQTETSLTIRLSYNITPDFTIQYYGQPFISAANYSKYKFITFPRAEDFYDKFQYIEEDWMELDEDNVYHIDENLDNAFDYTFDNRNFNFFEFRSNLVARWEYNPGSVIYFVWTQGRTGNNSKGRYSFSDDVGELFDIYPHNIFLIKFSYRFGL